MLVLAVIVHMLKYAQMANRPSFLTPFLIDQERRKLLRIKGTSWTRRLETVAVQNLHLPLTAFFCPSATGPPGCVDSVG